MADSAETPEKTETPDKNNEVAEDQTVKEDEKEGDKNEEKAAENIANEEAEKPSSASEEKKATEQNASGEETQKEEAAQEDVVQENQEDKPAAAAEEGEAVNQEQPEGESGKESEEKPEEQQDDTIKTSLSGEENQASVQQVEAVNTTTEDSQVVADTEISDENKPLGDTEESDENKPLGDTEISDENKTLGDTEISEENKEETNQQATNEDEGQATATTAEGEEVQAENTDKQEESTTPAAEAPGLGAMEDITEVEEEATSPLPPKSDAFGEGEKPEEPLIVGEKLSRGGTPAGESSEGKGSPLVPDSPGKESIHESEDEEEYEMEPQFDRDQLIERYHQALSERHQLQEQNYQLQHKLAEYFKRKKADERQDMDKNVPDQEQRYLKYMANLDELRRQEAEEKDSFKQQIEDMKEKCDDRQERVGEEQQKFKEFKKEIAYGSVNSRSGKPIPAKDIEQHFMNESRKEEEVIKVRLENIKLKNKLKKKEAQLKSKEELAEGLHMIDFEQLKIENQTYNEKIEERNEELLKLRKKITSTVQVLTHFKEKLQFVQGENTHLKSTLKEVEELAAKKRDILSRTKQARDGLRIDNHRLRQNCGLLGNESLLRDFEERKDEADELKAKLDNLKMQHAELTLNLNGVRRKIQQAQVVHQ